MKYQGGKSPADLYAWYYDTQACLMFGGTAWGKWNRLFQDEIANHQSPDGRISTRTFQFPYFLNLFKDHPEEIVIAERVGNEAKFHRLLDLPNVEEILQDADLGEVWYTGILGGVPTR